MRLEDILGIRAAALMGTDFKTQLGRLQTLGSQVSSDPDQAGLPGPGADGQRVLWHILLGVMLSMGPTHH